MPPAAEWSFLMRPLKGILLAGGKGSRLYPLTTTINKSLALIYDKPAIYYPLSVLMLAGIRDILIISTPRDIVLFKQLLGNGSHIGLSISYEIEAEPKGAANAFLIAEQFLDGDPCCLIHGDNFFYGDNLEQLASEVAFKRTGSTIFLYYVNDPRQYGVVEFKGNKAVNIEEKPSNPKSNWAVTGLFFYDSCVIDFVKKVTPSHRGELEITDLNKLYIKNDTLNVELLDNNCTWLDIGTPDSLLSTSLFVQQHEQQTGFKIACIEEISLKKSFITKGEYIDLIEKMPSCAYRNYLEKFA